MNGWFPKIDSFGRVISGNSGIWVTVGQDSKQISPAGTTPCWAWFAPVFNDTARGLTSFNGYGSYQGYNEYIGSDSFQWAGFDASGQGRVDIFHNGNRSQSINGACVPRFGGNRFCYLRPFQSESRELVVNGGVAAKGPIMSLAISPGGEVLVYQIATGTYTRQILSEDGKVLNVRDKEAPIATFIGPGGQPWLVTQTPDVGTLIYPAFSHIGYQITGDLFNPDARMLGDQLYVVGSSSSGDLRPIWVNFNNPRVDLRIV